MSLKPLLLACLAAFLLQACADDRAAPSVGAGETSRADGEAAAGPGA